MKPRSAKAKGRAFEKEVASEVADTFPQLEEGDVLPSHSSAPGIDVLLSPAARKLFKYGVEAKNHKNLSIPAWLRQCVTNAEAEGLTPALVFKQHRDRTKWVVLPWEHFLQLAKGATNGNQGEPAPSSENGADDVGRSGGGRKTAEGERAGSKPSRSRKTLRLRRRKGG